jgi:uncharacterized protein YbjT (DUF2867 family)
MVLVVGATGLLGTEVCQRLHEAGHSVRALVRTNSDREKLEALTSAGADLVIGDLKDSASIAAACAGTAAVVTTASSTLSRQEGDSIETVDRAGHLSLIDEAKRAGVQRFVYTSIPPDLQYDCPLFRAKREVERYLAASGLSYTVLLPNYFMEVWLSPALGFDYVNGRATIYGSGERSLAWISCRDVAAFAVDALGHEPARNRILTVAGPENLSPHDAVRVFEKAARRSFVVEHVPQDALEKQYAEAADPLAKSFAALMLECARGCVMESNDALHLMPRPLTTVEAYAAAVS